MTNEDTMEMKGLRRVLFALLLNALQTLARDNWQTLGAQGYSVDQQFPGPQPSYPAPSPSFPQPAPSYPQPAPSFPQPTPSYPQPAPSFPQPAPSYPQPAPSFPQPTPSYPQPAPSFPQPSPQPSYPQPSPQPSYPQPAPQPSLPQPAPSYPQPAPSFPQPAPQPSYPQPAPSFPQPAPSYPQPTPPPNYGPAPQPGYGGGGGGGVPPPSDDPCFRRFTNCIIVNAQPYERRSTVGVEECKSLCLGSNTGIFQCRAFVFDNVNRVCDLFGHTGNQHPARLMAFNGRDYYEPVQTPECIGGGGGGGGGGGDGGYGGGGGGGGSTSTTNGPATGPTCPTGQEARLLRIEGFELQGEDDVILSGHSADQCAAACIDNQARFPLIFVTPIVQGRNGESASCQSFDYIGGECRITLEAAVPAGSGQLVQNADSDYYEKICVSAAAAARCELVFERFPQMILVGFAETVIDANSFDECLDNCLNSQDLYGFACVSGMFYFQEEQLNCILNSEARSTQPELFVEEENDIVDYFETDCAARRLTRAQRLRGRGSRQSVISTTNSTVSATGVQPRLGEWTQWTTCNGTHETRFERCSNRDMRSCERQTRSCGDDGASTPAPSSIDKSAVELPADCPIGQCCAVFGGCRIGLIKHAKSGVLQWCTNPC